LRNFIITLLALTMLASPARAGIVSDPFSGKPIQVDGTFCSVTTWNAADFDTGGEGVAYHDLSKGNCALPSQAGWCIPAYRLTEDVDIQAETDGSVNILNAEAGEWLNYTIWVNAKEGNYIAEVSVAIGDSSAVPAYHIEVDGAAVTGSIPVGSTTGSFHTFEWRGKTGLFPIGQGRHVLRIVFDVPFFNLKSIRLKYAADADVVWTGYGYVPIWRVCP
jgi:hypothetical protein